MSIEVASAVASDPAVRQRDRRFGDVAALAAVAAVALLLHGWIAAYDLATTTFSDSMDYLFMADFYRSFLYGGEIEAATSHYRATRFPPLFPLLLGLAGAGTERQLTAAFVSNGAAVLAVVAVWIWARRETGDAKRATFVALGLVLFPYYFVLNLSPVSEPLGILLVAGACALVAAPRPSPTQLLLAGLLIGLAPLARTALLPLCIAFVIWLALRRPVPWRHTLLPIGAAWLPYLGWAAYRRALGAHSYTSYLTAEQFAEAGMSWPAALWQQPAHIFRAFVHSWGFPTPPAYLWAACVVIAGLAAAGCVLRMRRNRLDGWFLAGYVALVLIWPFPAEHTRFIVAIIPFLLLAAMTAAGAIDAALGRPHLAPATLVLVAATIAAATPALFKFARRAALPVPEALLGEKREPSFFILESDRDALDGMEIYGRGRLLLLAAREHVPAGACIYASPPQLGRLYSQRPTLAYPRGLGSDPDAVRARLNRCDYFFVGAWQARLYGIPPLYPSEGLVGWTEPVLVSTMKLNGRDSTVAALVRRRPASATAADRPSADAEPPTHGTTK